MLLANKVSIICGTRGVFLWAFTDPARALLTSKRPIWADSAPEADRVKIWQAVESFVYLADLRERFRLEDGVPAHKLTELLNVARFRDVTLQVDRVWSLLGVTTPTVRQAMLPFIDYSESAIRNYRLAYINFIRTLLPTDSYLTLFSYTTSIERNPSHPSWGPEYSTRPLSMTSPLRINKRDYHASFQKNQKDQEDRKDQYVPQTADLYFPPCTTSFSIKGFCIDYVDRIIPLDFPILDYPIAIPYQKVRDWEEQCFNLAKRTTPTTTQTPTGGP
jgi:hypothetical protein